MNTPFFISTAISVLCVLLSFLSFGKSQTSNGLQSELLKKQKEIQTLNQIVSQQNPEFNRQTEIINIGAKVAQEVGPPILREMGYVAAKNKNEKLKALLVKQKLESFVPSDEQFKQMEKQLEEARLKQPKQGSTNKEPAPATGTPATPALRP